MASVESTITIPATPEAVWDISGNFGNVANWHPAVARCTLEYDGKQRNLELVDGGRIVEVLMQHDDLARAYSYRIVDAPLPIENYQGTFFVEGDGMGGTTVTWSARFDVSDGAEPSDAERAVQGIIDSGLEHLKQLTGG